MDNFKAWQPAVKGYQCLGCYLGKNGHGWIRQRATFKAIHSVSCSIPLPELCLHVLLGPNHSSIACWCSLTLQKWTMSRAIFLGRLLTKPNVFSWKTRCVSSRRYILRIGRVPDGLGLSQVWFQLVSGLSRVTVATSESFKVHFARQAWYAARV